MRIQRTGAQCVNGAHVAQPAQIGGQHGLPYGIAVEQVDQAVIDARIAGETA